MRPVGDDVPVSDPPAAVFAGQVHPLAAVWPMLDGDELESLGESIAEIGLREPLALDRAGRLIDGRNRLDRCTVLGVEPRFVVIDVESDAEVAAYIQAANAERRHLKPGQLAMGRALMLAAQGKRKAGRWQRGSLTTGSGDISQQRMQQAGVVLDWLPELGVEVLAGSIALDDAHARAQAAEDAAQAQERAEKQAAARLADLRSARPDLAELVDTGRLPLDDAFTVRDSELAASRKAEADARARRRELRDALVDAVVAVRATADPGTLPGLLTGLSETPARAVDVTPAGLRGAAACLNRIADALEEAQAA